MVTAVKICGITRLEDALAAARCGAHAVGFVFHRPSPRYVSPEQAGAIIRALPPFVTPVALFVNEQPQRVREALVQAPFNLLQFHGDETPEYCRQFGLPYIKAVRVRDGMDLLQYAEDYRDAKALLLDAFVEGVQGGTGAVFDWGLIPRDLMLPVVLSGGLNSANVAEAIRKVRPWAADVSSGVETAKGIKSEAKIAEFILGVRNADV